MFDVWQGDSVQESRSPACQFRDLIGSVVRKAALTSRVFWCPLQAVCGQFT